MEGQSRSIPITQRQEVEWFNGRTKRFSVQRMRTQNPLPPHGLPAQVLSGFPRGDLQVGPSVPPIQPPPPPAEDLVTGYALPSGPPRALENVYAFAQQDQRVDLKAETPSPPVGFSAMSMRGFGGSPPLRTADYFLPFNGHQSGGICKSTPQHYRPPNRFSPPGIFPSPSGMLIPPSGVYGCAFCWPPRPQREEFLANNLPFFRPMPMPYVMDPSNLGRMPEVVEPNPMPDKEHNGNANGRRRDRKRRTPGKAALVPIENQGMKIAEQVNWKFGNRLRSSKPPARFCTFCRSNRETREFYQSHVLKNDDGVVSCPVLRKYTCPMCKASGDTAHTMRYCPENQDGPGRKDSKSALKEKRNSRGIIGAYRYD